MEFVFCWIRLAGESAPSSSPRLVAPSFGGGRATPFDCPLRGRADMGCAGCAGAGGAFATAPASPRGRVAPFDCPFLGRVDDEFVEVTETGAEVPSRFLWAMRPSKRFRKDSEEPLVLSIVIVGVPP